MARINYHYLNQTPKRRSRRMNEKAKIFWFQPRKCWAITMPVHKLDKRNRQNLTMVLDFKCDAIFEPRAKAWLAPEDKLEQIKAFLEEFFTDPAKPHETCYDFRPRPDFYNQQTAVNPEKVIDWLGIFKGLTGFTSEITKEQARSLYRSTAMRLHPDKGGSHEQMTLLNDSYKQIIHQLQ